MGKCDAKVVKSGFPSEIVDEEFLLDGIEVNEVMNLNEDSEIKVRLRGGNGLKGRD